MSDLQITLPDGSVKTLPQGSTPLDVAKSISGRLAEDAIVAKVNGDFWDLTRAIEGDAAAVSILTAKNAANSFCEKTRLFSRVFVF